MNLTPRTFILPPHYGTSGETWLEAEEIPYVSRRGRSANGRRGSRRARVRMPNGRVRTIRVGKPDSLFSLPGMRPHDHGYVMRDHTGEFVFVEYRGED